MASRHQHVFALIISHHFSKILIVHDLNKRGPAGAMAKKSEDTRNILPGIPIMDGCYKTKPVAKEVKIMEEIQSPKNYVLLTKNPVSESVAQSLGKIQVCAHFCLQEGWVSGIHPLHGGMRMTGPAGSSKLICLTEFFLDNKKMAWRR